MRFFDKVLPLIETIELHFGSCDIQYYIFAPAVIDKILQKVLVHFDSGMTSYEIKMFLRCKILATDSELSKRKYLRSLSQF